MVLTPGAYPTEAAVARIVAAEKEISVNIVWHRDLRHDPDWAKFSAPVENNGGWDLTLYGNARVRGPAKRSYLLVWTLQDAGHRIFSLDINGDHRNRRLDRQRWRNRTHKQIWRDEYPEFAYTPDETIPEEPVAAFYEFCREGNIVFSGQIGPFPTL